jgi:cytochrome P450
MLLRLIQWLVAQDWLMRLLSPVMGLFNPFSSEFRRDPFPGWRALREKDPVWLNRILNAWMVTEYDIAQEVLRSPDRFTTDRTETAIFRAAAKMTRNQPELHAMITRSLLMLDGAEHRKMRGLVGKAFTLRRVESLRPRVEFLVDELLDEMERENKETGHIRLMTDFAKPLPIRVIMELLGLPAEDRKQIHRWSDSLVLLVDPLQARGGLGTMNRAVIELNAYLRPLLEERRSSPKDDLLTALLHAESDGDRIDESDLLVMITLILVAGHETTTNLIGNAVIALLRNPKERKRLQDDPGLITTAVDEFLRYDGPIQLTDRAAISDCELAGRKIKKGQLVGVSFVAANRDPKRFADPDRLDLSRSDNQHLSLGYGNHFCLGAQLAKLETEVAIGRLVERFPFFTGPDEPDGWRRSTIIRGPMELKLELTPH